MGGSDPMMMQALTSALVPQTRSATQATVPGFSQPISLFGAAAQPGRPPAPMGPLPGDPRAPAAPGKSSGMFDKYLGVKDEYQGS